MVDLTVFCDPTNGRYDLSTPWVYKGWRYATDGRICVREPAPGEPDTGEFRTPSTSTFSPGKRPRAQEYFAKFSNRGFTKEWPEADCGWCPRCGQNEPTIIAGRRITRELVKRIALLGEVKFKKAGRPDEALAFIDEHGRQGLVMPLFFIEAATAGEKGA